MIKKPLNINTYGGKMETEVINTLITNIETISNKLTDLHDRQNFLDRILDRLLYNNKKDELNNKFTEKIS